jgi:ankyrin repeat protein
VDALDARGRTPLYVAAHHGHEDVVSSLLSAGADVNKREKFREETPLFAAARGGHLECVKALCAHEDVDVDARDDHWATPLHAAVAEGHVACVDWLLDRGADPNAADKNMETALHVSVRWADARVTASLLRAGASAASTPSGGSRRCTWR